VLFFHWEIKHPPYFLPLSGMKPDGKVQRMRHEPEDLPTTTTSTSFREKSRDENSLLQETFHF
jgi:hypothetical protein